jgi:hypothetical protein
MCGHQDRNNRHHDANQAQGRSRRVFGACELRNPDNGGHYKRVDRDVANAGAGTDQELT